MMEMCFNNNNNELKFLDITHNHMDGEKNQLDVEYPSCRVAEGEKTKSREKERCEKGNEIGEKLE